MAEAHATRDKREAEIQEIINVNNSERQILESTFQSKFRQVQADLVMATKEKDNLIDKLNEAEQEISKMSINNEGLKKRERVLQDEINKTKDQLSKSIDDYGESMIAINSLETEKKSLEDRLAEAHATRDKREAEVRDMINNERLERKKSEKKLLCTRSDYDKLRIEITSKGEDLKRAEIENNALSDELIVINEKYANAKNELESLSERCARLTKTLAATEKSLKDTENEEIKNLRAKLHKFSEEKVIVDEKLKESEQMRQSLDQIIFDTESNKDAIIDDLHTQLGKVCEAKDIAEQELINEQKCKKKLAETLVRAQSLLSTSSNQEDRYLAAKVQVDRITAQNTKLLDDCNKLRTDKERTLEIIDTMNRVQSNLQSQLEVSQTACDAAEAANVDLQNKVLSLKLSLDHVNDELKVAHEKIKQNEKNDLEDKLLQIDKIMVPQSPRVKENINNNKGTELISADDSMRIENELEKKISEERIIFLNNEIINLRQQVQTSESETRKVKHLHEIDRFEIKKLELLLHAFQEIEATNNINKEKKEMASEDDKIINQSIEHDFKEFFCNFDDLILAADERQEIERLSVPSDADIIQSDREFPCIQQAESCDSVKIMPANEDSLSNKRRNPDEYDKIDSNPEFENSDTNDICFEHSNDVPILQQQISQLSNQVQRLFEEKKNMQRAILILSQEKSSLESSLLDHKENTIKNLNTDLCKAQEVAAAIALRAKARLDEKSRKILNQSLEINCLAAELNRTRICNSTFEKDESDDSSGKVECNEPELPKINSIFNNDPTKTCDEKDEDNILGKKIDLAFLTDKNNTGRHMNSDLHRAQEVAAALAFRAKQRLDEKNKKIMNQSFELSCLKAEYDLLKSHGIERGKASDYSLRDANGCGTKVRFPIQIFCS